MESINPFTQKTIKVYQHHTGIEVTNIINNANETFLKWATISIDEHRKLILKLADELLKNKMKYASLITAEMGKPIRESIAEIEKCQWLCSYYAQEQSIDIQSHSIKTEAKEVYVSYEPLGVLFAIMPWNFPFWQVLRFSIPAITVGNTVILKHAPNVNGCALAIEELFLSAGFPKNVFNSIIIEAERSEEIISHPYIKGVTLTGSERAGAAVATLCGKYLKKNVLELGGSDPFIVCEDADLDNSCIAGLKSRMLNAGQVCIAAKRFIVHRSIYRQFIEKQLIAIQSIRCGDPMDEQTDIGPMARPDLLQQIDKQLTKSVKMGAKLWCGGKISEKHPQIYEPSLLSDVAPGMPVFDDETFGPIMAVMPFDTEEEAIVMANNSRFGLGASIWTKDLAKAKRMIKELQVGSVFVNSMVKSDPRTPFGGTKNSGYGRELTTIGIKEFMNIKTNWIE